MIATIIISPIVQIVGGFATARDYIAPFIQLGLLYYLINKKRGHFD